MSALLLDGPMARKSKTKRNDRAVKIEEELARKAAFIADTQGTYIAEYLSILLRPLIERDFAKAIKKGGPDHD